MDKLKQTLIVDDTVMKLTETKVIRRIICTTDKGLLELEIRKGDQTYHLVMDSVPLDKELNKQLMDLLFPVPKIEIPQVNKEPTHILHNLNGTTELTKVEDILKVVKPKGRPKGAKNH